MKNREKEKSSSCLCLDFCSYRTAFTSTYETSSLGRTFLQPREIGNQNKFITWITYLFLQKTKKQEEKKNTYRVIQNSSHMAGAELNLQQTRFNQVKN